MAGRLGVSPRTVLLVALAALVGALVAAVALSALGDDEPAAPTAVPVSSGPLPAPDPAGRLGDAERADSPAEAVRGFLAAERDGDTDASFALLARAEREAYGSPAAWRAAHPDVVPPVEGFEVRPTTEEATGPSAVVVTDTRYASSLDLVAGLVPARATTSWQTVQEDGGWAVAVEGSTQIPVLPADDAAPAAALEWARAAQACVETPPSQLSPQLRGQPVLAEQLCGAAGDLAAGEAQELPVQLSQTYTNAFGADATTWARAVEVSGPLDVLVVLAPVDDRWQVVGLASG